MRESKNLQEEGSLTAFQRGSEANKIDEDQEEDVKFNVTNFNSGQSVRQNLPQNRQLESLGEIVQNIIPKESVPRADVDLRRKWNLNKYEREKLLKQWNKAKKSLAHWVAKTSLLESQLNRNTHMRGQILADSVLVETRSALIRNIDLVMQRALYMTAITCGDCLNIQIITFFFIMNLPTAEAKPLEKGFLNLVLDRSGSWNIGLWN